MTKNTTITSVEGLLVGHAANFEAVKGCTVILCEEGAIAGVDVRGGAPGTRETDLCRPLHLVHKVHAILLSGGSAFGLDAASGVMRYLHEKNIGYPTEAGKVPIVPAAVIYDLAVGRNDVFPDASMGYSACLNASSAPVMEGSFGAGTGASVAKFKGMNFAMKSGVGSFFIQVNAHLKVAALMVINALGDVVDPKTGETIAAVRKHQDNLAPPFEFVRTLEMMQIISEKESFDKPVASSNTCVGVVATNARLNKEEMNKVAQMAHNGLARAISPAHTMWDGDTIFALATEKVEADVNIVGAFAAEAVSESCKRAVITARSMGGLPALC